MKVLRYSILLFVLFFSFLSAEELPKYKMIDLGVFGTDESRALEINDKGQVFGTFDEGKYSYYFLWDEINGLSIVEAPDRVNHWRCKLNNNGQIVWVCESGIISKIVYWDINFGFWEIESSKNGDELYLVAFNDKGQILGNLYNNYDGEFQIIIWDHEKKINLTNLFHEQVTGKWTSCRAISLNNRGHVVFIANKQGENQQDKNTGTKSFIWKDGSFSMILPEIGWETSVQVNCIDDEENMITSLYSQCNGIHSQYNGQYFVNQSKYMFVPSPGCNKIRNGVPIFTECLPGKLKKDRHGNLYFSKGVQIKKLLNEEFPFCNVSRCTEINDQNSNGYVVGTIDTMYPGRHAFLAIPETANKNNTKIQPTFPRSLQEIP